MVPSLRVRCRSAGDAQRRSDHCGGPGILLSRRSMNCWVAPASGWSCCIIICTSVNRRLMNHASVTGGGRTAMFDSAHTCQLRTISMLDSVLYSPAKLPPNEWQRKSVANAGCQGRH
jgi:hypothetical protein